MTENPQTPEGQQGDRPEAHIAGSGTTEGATERISQPTAAAPETPITSPTGADSPAEHQPSQAPGVAPTYSAAPAPQSSPTAQTVPNAAPAAATQAPIVAPASSAPTAVYPLNGTAPVAGDGSSFGPAATASSAPAATTTADRSARRRIALPVIGALALGALIGGGAGAGIYALASNGDSANVTTSSATAPNVTVNRTTDATTVTAVAAKASPSVVTISVSGSDSAGTGSGIILSADGYVLTNTHVVTLDGATADAKVQVTTNDGHIYNATVVGTDPIVDLAVIKLDGASGLTTMNFADSDKLNVGDSAIAIGAPLGLSGTVTDGIVSALNRSITVASSAVPDQSGNDTGDQGNGSQGPFDFWNFDIPGQQPGSTTASSSIALPVIQTDAAINPGNSGGALLNSSGELIGVNVAIASAGSSSGGQSGSIGVGFAIPANLAKRVSSEIIDNGSATHGLLGATVADSTSQDANADVAGAYIDDVTAGGAAQTAGLQKGDIITQFNGKPVTSQTDLTAQVRYLAAGAKADLTYVRNGESHTVSVTLGTLNL